MEDNLTSSEIAATESSVPDAPRQIVAGNTHVNLSGTDRDEVVAQQNVPSADDLDAVAGELAAKQATASSTPVVVENDDPLDDENTFDVSRAEFSELQDAFLRLEERIKLFNRNSGHKI